ncbi:MAG: hypothetical protein J1F35_01030 [Erysipelotrichales bacterium]|nr:hypothetical protein [Erysipelotrichales bacterium]
MERILKKILYVLLTITMLFITNYFIIKDIMNNYNDEDIIIPNNSTSKKLDTILTNEYGLYNKYELVNNVSEKETNIMHRVLLRSDCVVELQYYNNRNNETLKMVLNVNDKRIENEEEFLKEELYNINFHLYEDILVIEHLKSYNRIPFVKIINLTTGETRNLASDIDFYINNVKIDETGISVSYSRQIMSPQYYIDLNINEVPFTVDEKEIIIDVCKKNSWTDELYTLDYVSFDMTYTYTNNILNINTPVINNLKSFKDFMKNYTQNNSTICK